MILFAANWGEKSVLFPSYDTVLHPRRAGIEGESMSRFLRSSKRSMRSPLHLDIGEPLALELISRRNPCPTRSNVIPWSIYMNMDAGTLDGFKKSIRFIDVMFRMACASVWLAFGAGLKQLPLEPAGEIDKDIEEVHRRLRDAIRSRIKEFQNLSGVGRESTVIAFRRQKVALSLLSMPFVSER
ncbi:hypothetical protein GOL26_09495 [Sinorhizobium medicae]|nr:hypothetical protein [Sinorhizobium medicae]MDX1179027.1 hypothetical protein [Sinorhizobium medicae]